MVYQKPLKLISKIGFGCGHILNDICATLWFGYGLIYMQDILGISKASSGYIILFAQLVDAFFNLWVGAECDKVSVISRYGRRKGWHFVGTVMLLLSIGFCYTPPFKFFPGSTPAWIPIFHMVTCQSLFNCGWAIIQISHLSMIPSLAQTDDDDIQLNSIRQGNVYLASILVYLLAGVLIRNSTDGFQFSDRFSIMYLTYITITIGFLTSLAFQWLTPEEPTATAILESTCIMGNDAKKRVTWKEWFKKPGFYRVGILYTLTRLVYNMTMMFFPLLLSTAMKYPMNYVGYCPLVMYTAGMLYSYAISPIIKITNRKATFVISALFYIGASIWLEFLKEPTDEIWPIAILIGASSSGILILSLASIVDVVGENSQSSAFVYGIYSVIDKTLNGLGAVVIQLVSPCNDNASAAECTAGFATFFGRMMLIFCVLSCTFYFTLPKFTSKEADDDFSRSHMASVIVSNRFQQSAHISSLYTLRNGETRALLGPHP